MLLQDATRRLVSSAAGIVVAQNGPYLCVYVLNHNDADEKNVGLLKMWRLDGVVRMIKYHILMINITRY